MLSRVGHFRCAEAFCLSLPQTFFSQATGCERIIVNMCCGRAFWQVRISPSHVGAAWRSVGVTFLKIAPIFWLHWLFVFHLFRFELFNSIDQGGNPIAVNVAKLPGSWAANPRDILVLSWGSSLLGTFGL